MIRKPPSLEGHDFPRPKKKQSKREVDLQQRGQARRRRTSPEAKRKAVRKSKEVNVREG